MQLLSKLQPRSLHEVIVGCLIAFMPFTGWPQLVIEVSTRSISIEPAIVAVLFGGAYMLWCHKLTLIKQSMQPPWRYLMVWLLFTTFVGLVLANNRAVLLLQFVYVAAICSFASGIAISIATKRMRADWLIAWLVALGVVLAGIGIDQYLLRVFTDINLLRDSSDIGVFAFPRAHAVSLEPLVFTQWLLLPLFALLHQSTTKHTTKFSTLLMAILLLGVWLSLARSAFVALAIGLVVFVLLFSKQLNARWLRSTLALFVTTLAVTLLIVGTSTIIHSDKRFIDGVGRYLDHASLGIFNRQGATNVAEETVSTPDTNNQPEADTSIVTTTVLDTEGVVEGSTQGRIETIKDSLSVYRAAPETVVFGVGKNRIGEALANQYPDKYLPEQVTNNQYVAIIVEGGLIGLVILGLLAKDVSSLATTKKYHYFYPLVLAMGAQMVFYSNYVAFPVWIFAGLYVGIYLTRRRSTN